MSFMEKKVSFHKKMENWKACYSHVVFLHVRDCPIIGTTARRHELVVEDGLDGTPAAQAVFIEALDQKKLESLRR
jgi:hypothetical protein